MVDAPPLVPPVKKRASEQAYAIEALKRLRRLQVKCRREAAILGRSADLVFLHEDALCSVELKLSDWRRAFLQARDHQLAVDLAYVCLPGKRVSPAMQSEAENTGIGLLVFQDDDAWPFAIAVPAKESPVLSPNVRDRLLSSLF